MPEIHYSPRFARRFKKLSKTLKFSAQEKEIIFRNDPFDPRLKTHKLHGDLAGRWAFSISFEHRIVFSFENDGIVRFHDIGGHDVYV